jgi:xanthine dehydrogenase YagR molybdenum-binding subunit
MGVEKFGWSKRTPEPRSMKDGDLLVGWGVALATYPANQWAADVSIDLATDGTAVVKCATHDLGTGAYTVMTQISADAIGVPAEKVTFQLGNSDFPYGPAAGGSNSTATVGSAIVAAASVLHQKLASMAVKDPKSPLHGMDSSAIQMIAPGRLSSGTASDSFADILNRARMHSISAQGGVKGEKGDQKGFQSFGAQFCEVKIDPALPLVRVTRFVSVMDCGAVINPRTAGNQIVGGIVMGIGMALEEQTIYDPATGLPVTRNLADYHVPVNADIHSIEPYFLNLPDYAFNPMGARGMGEIGNTGTAAAVANAVFHATGRRVRDLPITLDKLI